MIPLPHEHNLFQVPKAGDFRDAAVALIVLDDGRYLMQLRDDKPGIFYPNHWGFFGGAVDEGEEPETALRRELMEELRFKPPSFTYFTRMDFDFGCMGAGQCYRIVYEVPFVAADISALQLREGRRVEPLDIRDALTKRPVVPYDSFAIWLHYAQLEQKQSAATSAKGRSSR
jgi:8-oxo-dGTP pyrophosphatase MutT (NUDIX family)